LHQKNAWSYTKLSSVIAHKHEKDQATINRTANHRSVDIRGSLDWANQIIRDMQTSQNVC